MSHTTNRIPGLPDPVEIWWAYGETKPYTGYITTPEGAVEDLQDASISEVRAKVSAYPGGVAILEKLCTGLGTDGAYTWTIDNADKSSFTEGNVASRYSYAIWVTKSGEPTPRIWGSVIVEPTAGG